MAQIQGTNVPLARLIPAPPIVFPGLADSNSPAVWERVDGELRLFVFNSESGVTIRANGPEMSQLESRGPVTFGGDLRQGIWFEAIIPDVDGVWYGYYHNELPADVCQDELRAIPRIGAARSLDFGDTWEDLGIVLEAPRGSHDCASENDYFVGGVGDFTVVLDQAQQFLYVFYSQYASHEAVQGVAVARMVWADRDDPAGKMTVWQRSQSWLPARMTRARGAAYYAYPPAVPIYRAGENWHGPSVDAFWGPSVHWNTHLQQYVMLLNRARDSAWTQDGVYVSFTPQLSEPRTWSTPERLIEGGVWYPQVLGMDPGTGSDREAGERARFFQGGHSNYFIEFSRGSQEFQQAHGR
jgi:hypothetical protein